MYILFENSEAIQGSDCRSDQWPRYVYDRLDTYMSFQSSEAGQCGDRGYVDYDKMGSWHRHVITSILMNKFHWLALIYLVTMIFKHYFGMSCLMAGIITFVWSHLSWRQFSLMRIIYLQYGHEQMVWHGHSSYLFGYLNCGMIFHNSIMCFSCFC
jgi:hypothetical protein